MSMLLQVGFTLTPRVTMGPVSSYLAFSSLPVKPAVIFCCTFLRVTSTGRYPTPCPVKPGLSSSINARDRPAYLLYNYTPQKFKFTIKVIYNLQFVNILKKVQSIKSSISVYTTDCNRILVFGSCLWIEIGSVSLQPCLIGHTG